MPSDVDATPDTDAAPDIAAPTDTPPADTAAPSETAAAETPAPNGPEPEAGEAAAPADGSPQASPPPPDVEPAVLSEPAAASGGGAPHETPSPPVVEPAPHKQHATSADEVPEPAETAAAAGETTAPAAETAAAPAPAGDGQEAEAAETSGPDAAPSVPESPAVLAIREALEKRRPVEGRVIGWNKGGFHLAIGELAAFCPRSEMAVGEVQNPESYLEQTLLFRVLRVQKKGRRIVVSRAAQLRAESNRQRSELRKKLKPGAVVEGTVASLTDFGAFVELGGGQGLVHVSEISHRRVEHPSSVLSEGQQVKVKVLKIEKGGRRISLSMRALEPDPWKELAKGLKQGAVVRGRVEKANQLGAFIEVAPGLTGLLPARAMSIPRETTPARAYPPGKEVSVQIISIDPRRQRISLAPEGSSLEGSRSDYKEYQRQRKESDGDGFNALASAFRRLENNGD